MAGVVVGIAVLALELVRDARQDHADLSRHAALLAQNEAHHEIEIRAAWQRVLDEALVEKVLGDGPRLQSKIWKRLEGDSADPVWRLASEILALCAAGGGRKELRLAVEQLRDNHQVVDASSKQQEDSVRAIEEVETALLEDFGRRGLLQDLAPRDSPQE